MNLNHDQLMKIGKAWAEGLTEGLGNNSTEVNRENDGLIRRKDAIDIASGYCHPANIAKELMKLPSAEPIIYCKDCKHWYSDADSGMACEFTNMSQPKDGFCNWAERRTDERLD